MAVLGVGRGRDIHRRGRTRRRRRVPQPPRCSPPAHQGGIGRSQPPRAAGATRQASKRFAHGTDRCDEPAAGAQGGPVPAFRHERRLFRASPLHLRPADTRAQLYRPCAAWPRAARSARTLAWSPGGEWVPKGDLEAARSRNGCPPSTPSKSPYVLFNAYRDPSHEQALRRRSFGRRPPDAHTVVARTRWRPSFPRVRARVDQLRRRLPQGRFVARYLRALSAAGRQPPELAPRPSSCASSGGVATPEEAAEHPATILVSGPAAGVRSAPARLAALAGQSRTRSHSTWAGTSTDVFCLIAGGRAETGRVKRFRRGVCRSGFRPSICTRSEPEAARSCGRDAGLEPFRVGAAERQAPNPGPGVLRDAAARRGTVTDANLLLDRLAQTSSQAASSSTAARRARARPAFDPRRSSTWSMQRGCLRALASFSVERGHDPTEFALVAFGAPGPLHACELADELGNPHRARCRRPPACLSALGLVASEERRRRGLRSYLVPLRGGPGAAKRGEARSPATAVSPSS